MEVLDKENNTVQFQTVYHKIFGGQFSFWKYALPIYLAGLAWRFSMVNSFLNRYVNAFESSWDEVSYLFKTSWSAVTIDVVTYPIFLALCIPLLIKWVRLKVLIPLAYIPLDMLHQWLATNSDVGFTMSFQNAIMVALIITLVYHLVKKLDGWVLLSIVIAYLIAEWLAFFLPAIVELYITRDESMWLIVKYLILDIAFVKYELVKLEHGAAAAIAFASTRYMIKRNSSN